MIKTLGKIKVLATRGNVYLNGASSFMVLRVFMKGMGLGWGWTLVAAATGFAAIVFMMWLEDRLGIFKAETEFGEGSAPS